MTFRGRDNSIHDIGTAIGWHVAAIRFPYSSHCDHNLLFISPFDLHRDGRLQMADGGHHTKGGVVVDSRQ